LGKLSMRIHQRLWSECCCSPRGASSSLCGANQIDRNRCLLDEASDERVWMRSHCGA
jgi:hypothetical protein